MTVQNILKSMKDVETQFLWVLDDRERETTFKL